MKISKQQYFTIIIAIISFILLFIIFKSVRHLEVKKYIVECFYNSNNKTIMEQTMDKYLNKSTSYSVDLPITTKYSCQNWCGPQARCAISGQQCLADIDCHGCHQPDSPKKKVKDCIPGNDEIRTQYLFLISEYGMKEKNITKDMYARPPQANFGIDTWGKSFNQGQILFNKRYKTEQLQYMPNYTPIYSITGEFIENEPLPSNY